MMNSRYVLSDKDLQDTVELTKSLVKINTESPEGNNYEEFITLLESEIKTRIPKIEVEKIIIPNKAYQPYPEYKNFLEAKRIILILKTFTKGKPRAHLNGHYDIVKAGDLNKWTVAPPYDPHIINESIYGRGACDMKGSIASLVKAIEIIYRENRDFKYDLTISFTPDEEVGSYSGLHYLIEQTKKGNKFIDGNFFFSLDGTQNEISIGKTGLITFEIEIIGKAAHIARSYSGINAVNLASPFLNEFIDLKVKIEQRVSKYPANPDLPFEKIRPNLSITSIHGGFSDQSVPDRCVIRGNRLVTPDESEDPMIDAQNELVNAIIKIKQHYQIELNFSVKRAIPTFVIIDDFPDLKLLRKVSSRIDGELFPVACSMGYNDVAWVQHELGIPTFSRGIQREGCNVHGFDENVPIKNIKIATEDLVEFLSK